MSPYYIYSDGDQNYSVHALKPGVSGRILAGNMTQTRAIEMARLLNEAHAAGVQDGTAAVRFDLRKALRL